LADIQNILPTTLESDYDPEKIPSVNLFSKDSDGDDEWVPIRNRQFNWSKGTLEVHLVNMTKRHKICLIITA
jgi:hypothetical protein